MSMVDQVPAKRRAVFMHIAMLFTGADEETLNNARNMTGIISGR